RRGAREGRAPRRGPQDAEQAAGTQALPVPEPRAGSSAPARDERQGVLGQRRRGRGGLPGALRAPLPPGAALRRQLPRARDGPARSAPAEPAAVEVVDMMGSAGRHSPARTEASMERLETALLAGGCFWCLEAVYDELNGVTDVKSGYAGGDVQNP